MRIALLNPTYWPEVRRGTERLVHDLGVTLTARGHEVTVVTSHAAPTSRALEDGIEVIRRRRLPKPRQLVFWEHHLMNAPNVVLTLLRERFDLAHAFHPSDAWAAVKAHGLGGPPVVFSYHGFPARRHLVEHRGRIAMMRTATDHAAATTVLSDAAAQPFRRYLLATPRVLHGGVRTADFAVDAPRAEAPLVFCAASLGDPRKRADVLFDAFSRLRRRRPDVRLAVARVRDPVLSRSEVRLPEGAEWVDVDRTPDLARAYATAWASVLPAVDEAFGLVLVESLAAGTPVVAARSGAGPEILADESYGRLFEPDDPAALSEALELALELAQRPETPERCRSRARDYDWDLVVERYEAVYESSLPSRASSSTASGAG